MIALTISDLMGADAACLRLSELINRERRYAVPDAICVRNDSFSAEPFSSMAELIGKLWEGPIVLESEDPTIITKSMVSLIGRDITVLGANSNNLEQFAMLANMFGCRICISDEDLENLLNLVKMAEGMGVKDIIIDPMMRNMKQCLEMCTDLKRLSGMLPEASHPVAVRTWSGEYAMTMASVSLLTTDALVIADDLDEDCCETLGALMDSMR